jgi:transposase
MALRVRDMTTDEVESIRRLAHARTESARTVERAEIIWQARAGKGVPAIARDLGVTEGTVRLWLKRFNAAGLDGLADRPRAGRPATYTPEQVGEVLAAALTPPQQLGLPFGSWTLDRLEVYLNEQKAIPIKRSRIDDLLLDEGLRWRQQETWFSERAALERAQDAGAGPTGEERVDPAFAQKRGPSSPSTPHRPLAASS